MSDGQFIERGTLDLWSDTMQEQRDTITTLRAQLAKAVEALRPFANIGIGSDPDYQPMIRMDRAAIIAARAAIARVKGETK